MRVTIVRNKAFTLIELLIVIAVIALVMAILMPAMAKARQQGKSVLCSSNLRQMSFAAAMYANENDEYFPMALINEVTRNSRRMCAWDFTTVSGQNAVEPGLLWQGEMIEKIQQCPSFRGAANWANDPYTGYNYNSSYLGGTAAVKNGEVVAYTVVMSAKVSAVRKTNECAVFGDGEWAEGANKFMRSPFPGKLDENFSGRYAGTQGFRHLGKTNVAWADGSVRQVRKCCTETIEGEKQYIAEGTGFLSDDNSAYDLQ
jgi:prepilin-type N-terminal cleavage/methylation domain-containing protein/prepilin-type processing-associated H-X9-DG protein